jgi:Signal transduction histidine kinase
MNSIDYIVIVVAAAAALAALIMAAAARSRERKTMETLNSMLDAATNGDFTESDFDESALSALETKMAEYLSASAVSARNLAGEKKKIEELVSDISHQTKTPIANILLYSELLSEWELDGESESYVKALRTQAEKLSFLISSLVKTSRLETGIITLEPSENSVDELIKLAVDQVRPRAEIKRITVTAEQGGCRAAFDMKWTTEAVYNILDNAVKYTGFGGSIEVSSAEYEMFTRIDIRDNGIGIDESEHAKIFTRFYRSQEVTDSEGAGIGLFLTRQIVTDEGGYVKVSSTKGMGSIFSVFLPKSTERK